MTRTRMGVVALGLIAVLVAGDGAPAVAKRGKRVAKKSSSKANCLNVGVVSPGTSTFTITSGDLDDLVITITVTVTGTLPPSGTLLITVPAGAGDFFGPFPTVETQGTVTFTFANGLISGTLRITEGLNSPLIGFQNVPVTFTPGGPVCSNRGTG